jgi:spore coat protein CotH
LCAAALALAGGCATPPTVSDTPPAPGATPAPARSPIFDPAVLHQVEVTMDPAEWQLLRDDIQSNRYYVADVVIDGQSVAQVGVRSRGGATRSPDKPSLHVRFEEYVSARRFHGLQALAIKNMLADPTLMREYLAMAAYEAASVPAPAVSFARLRVNGEYRGVYGLVEAVEDEHFLETRFGESGGQLYQYDHREPWDFGYRGDDPALYVPVPFKPETNQRDPDISGLMALIRAVNSAPDATFTQEIAALVDLDRLLTFMAVENAVAEGDGLVGFVGMNNFHLYQHAGRFVFIAWDRDGSFNSPAWPVFHRLDQNVLTRRLLADPAVESIYLEALRRTVDEVVTPEVLGSRLEAAYALIREAVLEDSHRAHGNDEFEAEVDRLRTFVASRRASVSRQLAALGR